MPDIGTYTESDYIHSLELPHILRTLNGEIAIIAGHDLLLYDGMSFQNEDGKKYTIVKILERHNARGDWSRNGYDNHPDFIRASYKP